MVPTWSRVRPGLPSAPSAACQGPAGGVSIVWRGRGSNPRPSAYEADELPLLHPAPDVRPPPGRPPSRCSPPAIGTCAGRRGPADSAGSASRTSGCRASAAAGGGAGTSRPSHPRFRRLRASGRGSPRCSADGSPPPRSRTRVSRGSARPIRRLSRTGVDAGPSSVPDCHGRWAFFASAADRPSAPCAGRAASRASGESSSCGRIRSDDAVPSNPRVEFIGEKEHAPANFVMGNQPVHHGLPKPAFGEPDMIGRLRIPKPSRRSLFRCDDAHYLDRSLVHWRSARSRTFNNMRVRSGRKGYSARI